MNPQKTGEFLKCLRKEKGLTQEQLAERFFVSSRTVSRWETGSNMPDLGILIDLAEFYGTDIRDIIDGERKSETMEKETLTKIADYSKCLEKTLLRKLVVNLSIGIVAWAVTFVFMLSLIASVQGAGVILIYETAAAVLYGISMACLRPVRNTNGFLNAVIGAEAAAVVSNLALFALFFHSGSYHNYGLIGAAYSLWVILAVFLVAGIAVALISSHEGAKSKTEHK